MLKLIKDSLLWRGLYFILSFITTLILSHFLGAEVFGKFSYQLAFASLLILIFSVNIDSAITYFLASQKIKPSAILLFILMSILLFSICFFILVKNNFIGINNYDRNTQLIDNKLFTFYSYGLFFIGIGIAIFNGLQHFKFINIILSLAFIFLNINLFLYCSSGNYQLLSIYCIAHFVIGQIVLFAGIFKLFSFKEFSWFKLYDLKQFYNYALIIMLSNLAFFLVYRIDFYFVEHWIVNKQKVGNYIQASRLTQMLLVLPQMLAGIIFPIISDPKTSLNFERLGKILRFLSLFFICIFLSIVILGKWLFPLLFGNSFNQMYYSTIILIPGIYSLSISSILSAYLGAINKNIYNLIAALGAIFLMIILSILSFKIYSIELAAGISSISYILEFLIVRFYFLKNINKKVVISLVPKKEDILNLKHKLLIEN